ncbi:MAG: YceI family protein [Pseudomonadota bacterium]
MKVISIATLTAVAALMSPMVQAEPETYVLDTKGSHAFIQFKIQHLGYSWLLGQFNEFDGQFILDEDKIENSSVQVDIKTTSVDSNHAERDKHLRGEDFLNTEKFPTAKFVSSRVEKIDSKKGKIHGNLTLNGVTKPVVLETNYIGGGKDPWGAYRQGFEATTQFKLKDYNIDYDLGPASQIVRIYISAEGIRQKQ